MATERGRGDQETGRGWRGEVATGKNSMIQISSGDKTELRKFLRVLKSGKLEREIQLYLSGKPLQYYDEGWNDLWDGCDGLCFYDEGEKPTREVRLRPRPKSSPAARAVAARP